MTFCTPAFAAPFLRIRSEQWKPPGMMFNGAEGRDLRGPPGRYSEDMPEVRQGSNSLQSMSALAVVFVFLFRFFFGIIEGV